MEGSKSTMNVGFIILFLFTLNVHLNITEIANGNDTDSLASTNKTSTTVTQAVLITNVTFEADDSFLTNVTEEPCSHNLDSDMSGTATINTTSSKSCAYNDELEELVLYHDEVPPIFLEDPRSFNLVYHPLDQAPLNISLATQVDLCGYFCVGDVLFTKGQPCNGIICQTCYCGDNCAKYGKCCPESNGTFPAKRDRKYSCVDAVAGLKFYMIKTCHENFTGLNIVENDDIKPVTSLLTNETYFNEFFAFCNNDVDFVSWQNYSICESIIVELNDTNNKTITTCHQEFVPTPENIPHKSCIHDSLMHADDIIRTCDQSQPFDPILQELCQNSSDYFVQHLASFKTFKNGFCYLCNLEPFATICKPHGLPSIPKDNVVIADLLNTRGDVGDVGNVEFCTETEVMDPISETCMVIYCASGRILRGNKCPVDGTPLRKIMYLIQFQFSINNISVLHSWDDVLAMTSSNFPNVMSKYNPIIYGFDIELLSRNLSNTKEPVDNFEVGWFGRFRSQSNMTREDFEKEVFTDVHGPMFFHYMDTKIKIQPNVVDDKLMVESFTSFNYDPVSKTCCTNASYYELEQSLADTTDGFVAFPDLYIDLSYIPLCPFIRFSDFYIAKNGSATIFQNNLTLNKNEYILSPLFLQVCVTTFLEVISATNYTSNHTSDRKVTYERMVLIYFSHCSISLSMIGICLTLVTFALFPGLRSLPNKNTMFLSASLFAAQTLFQFGAAKKDNRIVCQTIGVLIHFLWLSVIFWMNVCCYHMYRVFTLTSRARMSSSSHWKTLLKYSCYAFGLPTIIVCSTITASFVQSLGTSIGYGDGSICYINSPLVVKLTFILPLGITTLLNTVLFSLAIYTISKITKIQHNSSADRGHLLMYVKLSSLTGVFWMLAILAEVTNAFWLHIISQMLNGTQGVFIFLSCMANKRILKLWLRACRKKSTRYESGTSSSTTTQHSKY